MKPIKKLDYFIQVHETLSTISTSTTVDADSSSRAKCLLYALTEYGLMVSLCVSRHLLLHFKHKTSVLQGHDGDIVTGYTMIEKVKETLSNVSWIQFDFGTSMKSPTLWCMTLLMKVNYFACFISCL